MGALFSELAEVIKTFDNCDIPEDRQRRLITEGVYFEFNRNDSVRLDCFKFAKLLKICKALNSDFDANKMLRDLNERGDDRYEHIVKYFLQVEKEKKEQQKTL